MIRACLNADLGQSFKEIVADGDSFLTFASHSIFRYSSRVKPVQQLIYISLRLSAAAQGEYGIDRDRGRGVAKAGLVWPAKGPFRSGTASAGVGLDNMMSVVRPCVCPPHSGVMREMQKKTGHSEGIRPHCKDNSQLAF
jgi:hypothetical protein